MQRYIRKITRQGQRSLGIIIPAPIARELKLKERQKMVIRRTGKKIIIADWEK